MPEKPPIRLWIDDIRVPDDGWIWVRTYPDAIDILSNHNVEELSLDFDLGEWRDRFGHIRTGYDVLLILVQKKMLEHQKIPSKIVVHSQDFDNANKMQDVIDRYLK